MTVAEGIMRGAAGHDKPMLVCFMGKVASKPAIERMKIGRAARLHVPGRGRARAAGPHRYRQWLDRPRGTSRTFGDFDRERIAGVFEHGRARARSDLTLAESLTVVEAAGIRVAPWREAREASTGGAAPTALGYPVALKVSSARAHAQVGRRRRELGLADGAAVRAPRPSCSRASARVDPEATLVVQTMSGGGTEVIFGASPIRNSGR